MPKIDTGFSKGQGRRNARRAEAPRRTILIFTATVETDTLDGHKTAGGNHRPIFWLTTLKRKE